MPTVTPAQLAAATRKRKAALQAARDALAGLSPAQRANFARQLLSDLASEAYGLACQRVEENAADGSWRHLFWNAASSAAAVTSQVESCVRDVEYRARKAKGGTP